jgi:hypothetical protein
MLSAVPQPEHERGPHMDAPAHWAGTEPVRILDADGTAVGDPDVGLSPDQLRELLRLMVRARRLDREWSPRAAVEPTAAALVA